MTNQQFLTNFYNQLNKVRTLQGPGYDPTEVSLFATEAQELLVITKYNPESNILGEGFEENEKRIEDLGNLVRNRVLTPIVYDPLLNMPNGVFVDLPDTLASDPTDYSNVYWFTVFEQAITNGTDCDGNPLRVDIYEINHNEYTQLLNDPFNCPSDRRIWRMRVEGNRHELITDGSFTITGYHFRYIKKPKPIDLTLAGNLPVSELSDQVQREILRKTVELVLDDTENRTRIAIEESKRKE